MSNSAELPPNASIGEVRAEIDNARHDAAKTVAVLAERFTVSKQARRQLRGAAKALSWDGRRVKQDVRAIGGVAADAIPPGVTDTAKKAAALLARLPMWVKIGVPAIIVLRLASTAALHNGPRPQASPPAPGAPAPPPNPALCTGVFPAPNQGKQKTVGLRPRP